MLKNEPNLLFFLEYKCNWMMHPNRLSWVQNSCTPHSENPQKCFGIKFKLNEDKIKIKYFFYRTFYVGSFL